MAPAANIPVCCRSAKSSCDRPAPTNTTAAVRGVSPSSVPRANGPSGTLMAAMARFVAANGEFGGSRSNVTMNTALANPLCSSARYTAFHFVCCSSSFSSRSPDSRHAIA